MNEAEWQTRKDRIDTKLRNLNPAWQIIPWRDGLDVSKLACHAVLAKTFRGQLVPQDPTDEPAEKLLERIRKGSKQ